MDANNELAARMRDIAPFHVMEVQTAARALEAATREREAHPMGGCLVARYCFSQPRSPGVLAGLPIPARGHRFVAARRG